MIKQIKNIKWRYCINRKESLLFRSLGSCASQKYFKNFKGISWRARDMMHFGEGDFFINPDDLTRFRSIFFGEGTDYFYKFRKNAIFYVKKIDELSNRLEKLDHKKLSDSQLYDYIGKYFKASLKSYCFLLPFPLFDKLLSDKILNLLPSADAKQKQEWLKILAFPVKENEHTKEERAFLKLVLIAMRVAKNYKTSPLFNRELENHLKKFSWIGGRYLWEESWTKEDLIKRAEEFLEEKKNIVAALKHLQKLRRENHSNFCRLIKELNIKKSSELYKCILLARDFSYLRTWRTDNIYRSFYRTKNLFRELAARVGLKNLDDIRYLGFEEIVKTLENKKLFISAAEIAARKNFYAVALFKGKSAILSGAKWKKELSFLLRKDNVGEIKGTVAFKGKVKGKVKIVMQNSDLEKVAKGDIMVATMTFPHFIPAMEKAGAFITDEGGILCHAAIVAREMRKPCVIGTGNATRVLKDGDLVEVDAERGIVKIVGK